MRKYAVRYRLGLDLGTNSLGWCIVQINEANEPVGLVRLGVRLFRDGRNPKDKASLAVARRMARGMRRRRDRWLKRQKRFMAALIQHGLMPADADARRALAAIDPYILRKRGLSEALTLHELGRALFHLNQRRGFRSNRKIDKADEKESGKIKSALKEVRDRLAAQGARTVGEWLADRHTQRQPVRARLRGQGAKAAYELYVGRDMIADEFDALWAVQVGFNPSALTSAARDELRDILLYQRPLRPVRPGRCTLEPEDERAPLALPSAQRFRILQELNHLRYETGVGEERTLTLEQRDLFALLLEGQTGPGKRDKADARGQLSFNTMRRMMGLPDTVKFSIESDKREGLKCNATSLAMAKADRFGVAWHQLSLAQQDAVVELLLDEERETAIVDWLMKLHGLDEAAALKVANTGLADSHSNLGRKALAKVLPHLAANVVTYDKAVLAAGYASHSQLHTGEYFGHSALPYYGRILQSAVGFGTGNPEDSEEKQFGRIANPTVHIGLNQLRRLVNAVIDRYGPPTQIALEVTRELKQSRDQKERIQKEQAENQKQRDADREELQRLGLRDTGENLLRLKLWRELNIRDPLDRRCPYTGRQIGREKLFSEEVEIEHILPFARTLDDSIANKTLAYREANRYKKNSTPFEAFGQSLHGFDWQAIQDRAANMPSNKKWRFADNAMEQFETRHGGDFLARHLTDTAYLSRTAKAYLSYVCHPNDVWVTPGRLTALLRGKWGLNQLLSDSGKKDRTDHRHHALDAATIAVTDRSLLQKMATLSAQERLEREKDRILVPYPWEGFRDALEKALPRIVVSYKPDHGHQAGLHNDTAYGFAEPYEPGRPSKVVHRVPLLSLTKLSDLDDIRDNALRERIKNVVAGTEGKDFAAKLAMFAEKTGISRVRVVETLTVIPMGRGGSIPGRGGQDPDTPYKAYKGDGNYCVEIYRDENGRWRDHIVTSFEAAQIARRDPSRLRHKTLAQNGMSLVMRLCQDDCVALEINDVRSLYRVNNFSQNGQIFMAPLNEANTDGRNRDKSDPFTYISKKASSLFDARARRVFVTELGYVLDPGFKP
ncbi:type II CRISPR RNA-guided endonuclease Cas9 [Sinimarinibacterium flocculans]|uniref:type II CRISPR RNA-guided endonuclease Cas9 n=1 Tax=Sinimarinibacterium flocculans TaxID=985250 RepID=UPI00351473EF